MTTRSLAEYLHDLSFEWNGCGSLNVQIKRVVCDSRTAGPGDLFVALKGPVFDGHRFVDDVIRHGVSAIMIEKNALISKTAINIPQLTVPDTHQAFSILLNKKNRFPTDRIRVIGITGTNGKTTTAFLIKHLMSSRYSCGVIGTIEHAWPGHSTPASNTTPGPEVLLPLLHDMAEDGVEFCAMEVSSHGLQQKRTSGIRFETAVFTNLTQDHLDYHGSLEEYFAAKRCLFVGDHEPRVSVINVDDSYGKHLFQELEARAVSCGIEASAQYRAFNLKLSIEKSLFEFSTPAGTFTVETNLILHHNVYNSIAAMAACTVNGFSIGELLPQMKNIPQIPGRMERISGAQGFHVFVDYAHTPDAVGRVLASVRPLVRGKLITVFGCGGDRDRTKRPMMGRIAAQVSDSVIVTSDNPRSEKPEGIIDEIVNGMTSSRTPVRRITDRETAIREAIRNGKENDVIMILGKGHEKIQVFSDHSIAFDDCDIARQSLKSQHSLTA